MNKLKTEIITSIYYATDKDKIILQIQSKNKQEILGYIKLSLTENGKERIKNEKKGIGIFQKLDLIPADYLIFDGEFEELCYVFLKTIDGSIDYLEQKNGSPFSENHKRYLRESVCQKDDGTCYRMSEQEYWGRQAHGL